MAYTAKKKGPAGQDISVLKQQLKAEKTDNLYVFFGEEAYLRNHYLNQLRALLVEGFAQEFNHHVFEGKTLELGQLTNALEAMPMLAEHTLVEVHDFELFKAREEVRDALVTLLSDIPPWACLVFVFNHVEYATDGRLKKLTEAMKRATVIEFARQGERELTGWIQRRFKSYDKLIDGEQCRYLIHLTGGGMADMIPEIEKTAAYSRGQVITKQDLDAVVIPALEASTFDIANQVSQGDFAGAMTRLQTLYQLQNDPIPILWSLGKQLRQMYAARVLLEQCGNTARLQALYAMKDYPARQIAAGAQKFTTAWCAKAVSLCAVTDYRLKSSFDDANRLLELLLLQLAQEAGHG